MSQSNTATKPSADHLSAVTYDFSVEETVYRRERERLIRDHLGKFVLIHGDELVGVFETFDEAIAEGGRRFGWVPMMIRDIVADDEGPIYIPHADINDPAFRRID